MVLHVDGTTPPSVPALPEYLKAHVYLPPNLLNENPDSHESIARIVQTFIEVAGVPTVMRWRSAAQNSGWSLTQVGLPATPNSTTLPTIPPPITPMSSYYVFPGRPYGSLQPSTSLVHHPSPSPSVHSFGLPNEDDLYEDDGTGNDWTQVERGTPRQEQELIDAQALIAEQEATIEGLRQEVRSAIRARPPSEGREGRSRQLTSANRPSTRTTAPPRLETLSSGGNVSRSVPSPSPSAGHAHHHISNPSPARSIHPGSSAQNSPPASPSKSRSIHRQPSLREVRFVNITPTDRGVGNGGLQSFGPNCEAFIDAHDLSDRLHKDIMELYRGTLESKWARKIKTWFNDYELEAATELSEGLHAAMCQDAEYFDVK